MQKKLTPHSGEGQGFAADYIYADNGNVDIVNFHNPQVQSGGGPGTYQWDFGYDGLNRLTEADFGDNGTTGTFDVAGLNYDDAGNITGLQRRDETGSLIDNLTYSYAGSNRLQSVSDGVSTTSEPWDAEDASFGYDPSGNLTSQSGKLTNVAYDHRNLPVHFYLDGGNELVANYNADGQRILKELKNGSWQFYVMDGPQTLAVIKDGTLSHINLVGNSTFGRWEPGGTRRYYITDHLGSTRAVVDDGGTVLETYDYYPGGLHMPQRTSTTGNTIEKFTGKERDESLGLDYFGARYYDPAIWRWNSVDPRAGDYPSWSPYNYALNNPTGNIDPDGEFVLSFLSGFARGIFSGKRVGESLGMGVQSVRNSVGILSSFVRGNFGQIVSKFTWQLPQQALGVLGGNIRNFAGDVRGISHRYGATLIETRSSGWGGFTLGSVIQAQRGTEASATDNLFTHEYGHYLQSQRLGPAYLPGIGLPSLGSAAFNDYQGHSRFYTERWADRLSERFFDNRTEEERAEDRQRLQELIQKAKDNGGTWRRQDEEEEEDEFRR